MRVLHVTKTSDGAAWAAAQANYLHRAGIEVHVVVPASSGRMISAWKDAGARLHVADLSIPISKPWLISEHCRRAQELIDRIKPSLIHSHFFTTTMLLRKALGSRSKVPLVFQVPGPLHLENALFRAWDLKTARASDYWIASSRCIADHYRRAGVHPRSVFLSYYGFPAQSIASARTNALRDRLGIPASQLVVGSICHVYAPKYYLGQRHGLKNHETMIRALALVTQRRTDITAVFAGGPWTGAERYFDRLRALAERLGHGRILMPGPLTASEARLGWADYDCVVHIPTSENCGGVIEPLAAHVPVVAARVGGLPEVILNGQTGVTVSPCPDALETAEAVLAVLEDQPHHRRLAEAGAQLVGKMFDVQRTAEEVRQIYMHLLDPHNHPPPCPFDPFTAISATECAHVL